MRFRMQIGRVVHGSWVETKHDQPFDADDFKKAQSKAKTLSRTGVWSDKGDWLRVLGENGRERRWPPVENA